MHVRASPRTRSQRDACARWSICTGHAVLSPAVQAARYRPSRTGRDTTSSAYRHPGLHAPSYPPPLALHSGPYAHRVVLRANLRLAAVEHPPRTRGAGRAPEPVVACHVVLGKAAQSAADYAPATASRYSAQRAQWYATGSHRGSGASVERW